MEECAYNTSVFYLSVAKYANNLHIADECSYATLSQRVVDRVVHRVVY